ncbi:MAG: chorismate mutase [Candidatus Bathyarchaeia archaeon]|jgi:chorismate mutase
MVETEISQLREKVDAVDDQILHDLLQRVKICRVIGELKKQQGKPVHDIHRETEVLNRVKDHAERLKLDPLQVERIFREIVNMCTSVQQ